jgi:hypothetical protein
MTTSRRIHTVIHKSLAVAVVVAVTAAAAAVIVVMQLVNAVTDIHSIHCHNREKK